MFICNIYISINIYVFCIRYINTPYKIGNTPKLTSINSRIKHIQKKNQITKYVDQWKYSSRVILIQP